MANAYVTGLRWLARRELSESQVRVRLTRLAFEPPEIEAAVARLLDERALDDGRTAMAFARTEAFIKRRGRLRVLRGLATIGIPKDVAAAAVAEVFGEIDEDLLIRQTMDRRLRDGQSLENPTVLQRIHRALITQGFDPSRVRTAIRNRAKTIRYDEER